MEGLLETAARESASLRPDRLVAVAWETHGWQSLDSCALSPAATLVWDTRSSGHPAGEIVVGFGAGASIETSGKDRWDETERRSKELFADLAVFGPARPRFFGGFAFSPGVDALWRDFGDASFVIPRWTIESQGGRTRTTLVLRAGELSSSRELSAEAKDVAGLVHGAAVAREGEPSGPPRVSEGAPDGFMRMVERALGVIEDGSLDKIVLSRTTRLFASGSLDRSRVLARLAGEEGTTRFCIERGGRAFIGATPERLLTLLEGRVQTEAVAGSIARSRDVETECAALMTSDKDRREHDWVVRAIVDALSKWARDVEAASAPQIRSLRHLHHLVTPISATLAEPAHVLQLVQALHPTPAVSGWPIAAATRILEALEGRARGWYASPIGWFDARGEGSFVVGIRSALLSPEEASVFAGAGIVRGSDPRAEWNETCVKQTSMLRALGAT